MKHLGFVAITLFFAVTTITIAATAQNITTPPETLKLDPFYKKYLDSSGLPIVSSGDVPDAALLRANTLINNMLANRMDIRESLIDSGVRFVVMGAKEMTTDIPEYSQMKPKKFWDERARGLGGRVVSCGEENLLCYPVDRYDDENILIHEFAHCIGHSGIGRIDKEFDEKLKALYEKALAKGLWKNTYAGSNAGEYWAEGVQSYYDANRQNNYNHNHVDTREELEAYDPDLARFIAEVFRHTPKTDWRYKPLAIQPQVTSPPKELKCDAFYKKYVRARGFPILSSQKVSDEALIEANYLIRNMFAYRHDVLKALIDSGVRFVILGKKEKIRRIPECRELTKGALDKSARFLSCGQEQPVIICGEENLLNLSGDRYAGRSILIREFARALHVRTGLRAIDKEFESRKKQQYELRVKRIDREFDGRVKELYNAALKKGLWKDTFAAKDRFEYFSRAVQSWFDANTQDISGHNHVNTREELEAYDEDLAEFIAEVFQHTYRVDWRYQQLDKRK